MCVLAIFLRFVGVLIIIMWLLEDKEDRFLFGILILLLLKKYLTEDIATRLSLFRDGLEKVIWPVLMLLEDLLFGINLFYLDICLNMVVFSSNLEGIFGENIYSRLNMEKMADKIWRKALG